MATTAGFAIMFGAGFYEVLASALAGFISGIGVYGGKKAGMQSFLRTVSGHFAGGHIYSLCSLPAEDMDLNVIIIASIMPLVPGVAITNAV